MTLLRRIGRTLAMEIEAFVILGLAVALSGIALLWWSVVRPRFRRRRA